ncbi:MAG: FecR domain-containing protein, partial [Rubrivivax sp.]|nr:FecR domain-containing protein [Rubrivivax sp.]
MSLNRSFKAAVFGVALAWLGGAAATDGDPPGRVGRLADLQGAVSVYDDQKGEWAPAQRNRPLTGGDRLSTSAGARAELQIGSTTLRLAGGSELELLRLDDERMQFQLHAGSLALRVRSRDVADELEMLTAEARLRPLRAGHYRIDRRDDNTQAGVWRGQLRVDDGDGFDIDEGRRVELWREGPRRGLRHVWTPMADDAFAAWVAREDAQDERSAAQRHVSPEMTGA